MQLILITETPDLVLERNLSSGLLEQVPCDMLSNRSLAVPQGCCARFPRASVDILKVGQCAPSGGSQRAKDESNRLQMTYVAFVFCLLYLWRLVERAMPFTFCV